MFFFLILEKCLENRGFKLEAIFWTWILFKIKKFYESLDIYLFQEKNVKNFKFLFKLLNNFLELFLPIKILFDYLKIVYEKRHIDFVIFKCH